MGLPRSGPPGPGRDTPVPRFHRPPAHGPGISSRLTANRPFLIPLHLCGKFRRPLGKQGGHLDQGLHWVGLDPQTALLPESWRRSRRRSTSSRSRTTATAGQRPGPKAGGRRPGRPASGAVRPPVQISQSTQPASSRAVSSSAAEHQEICPKTAQLLLQRRHHPGHPAVHQGPGPTSASQTAGPAALAGPGRRPKQAYALPFVFPSVSLLTAVPARWSTPAPGAGPPAGTGHTDRCIGPPGRTAAAPAPPVPLAWAGLVRIGRAACAFMAFNSSCPLALKPSTCR